MSTPAIEPAMVGRPLFAASGALWPWYAAEWLNSYASTMILWCIPYYVIRYLHGTAQDNLWLMAGWGFAYAAFSLIAGHLVERWGPRKLILRMCLASAFTALAGLLTLRFPNLWLLFAAMTAYNLTSTQLWPALESAITRSPGRLRLSTRTSLYNITWSSSGFVAAATFSIILWMGWQAIFIMPAIAALLAGVLIMCFAIPPSALAPEHAMVDPNPPETSVPRSAEAVPSSTLLYMAWIANAMGYVCINVIMAVAPILTGTHTGALGSVWKLTAVVGFILFWKWRGWHYKPAWMFTMYAALGLSFFTMLSWPNVPVLIASQAVFGLCTAFVYSSSLYYAMHVSSGAGSHAGIHEALIGVGIAIGSSAGAMAASGATSLAPIAWVVSIILACGALAMGILAARRSLIRE